MIKELTYIKKMRHYKNTHKGIEWFEVPKLKQRANKVIIVAICSSAQTSQLSKTPSWSVLLIPTVCTEVAGPAERGVHSDWQHQRLPHKIKRRFPGSRRLSSIPRSCCCDCSSFVSVCSVRTCALESSEHYILVHKRTRTEENQKEREIVACNSRGRGAINAKESYPNTSASTKDKAKRRIHPKQLSIVALL